MLEPVDTYSRNGYPVAQRSGASSRRLQIGVALGGGFARAIAHVGVLRVLESAGVRISAIGGISAGAMVAAAYASGRDLDAIAAVARSMRFSHVARWCVSRMGLAGSCRMCAFLRTLLRSYRFEEMRIPLSVVATDLVTGSPTAFRTGDVIDPIRASCAYPGLLEPVPIGDRLYVDGAIGMEVPTAAVRDMQVDKLIGVRLVTRCDRHPANFFEVINRCFRIMNEHTEATWRTAADLVIEPDVSACAWNDFASASDLISAGEQAAQRVLPTIREWLQSAETCTVEFVQKCRKQESASDVRMPIGVRISGGDPEHPVDEPHLANGVALR